MNAPYLALFPLLPMLLAPVSYALGRKKTGRGYAVLLAVCLITLVSAALLFAKAYSGGFPTLSVPGVCFFGLTFRADGFRALYVLVAAFMWTGTSLFTPDYMSHGHKQPRYCFFTLMTLGATVGVFLSDDLFTAFLFFEIMSFTSYPWVAHEETPGAMRAGATYLAIAIFGGMAMLMGLMMLSPVLGTLSFAQMAEKARALPDKSGLYLPSALILAGFGAKAGMFPLHVWLPKAHPVAPAPASALLSGVLTKVGIFGALAVSAGVMAHDVPWGNMLLLIGLVTMFLGALLALLSVDLKRTLACSSMSQIGFIVVGIAMQNLLGEHNALAAEGTVLHMLNHSLIKLVLFMSAGAVVIGAHSLDLNRVRGYGRKKIFLHLCFLIGAASISGIPLFSGYISKTLLHESIVEYIEHLRHLHLPSAAYGAAEWVFIVTGGMTFAYMLKLYICLFWQKNNDADWQKEMDENRRYLRPASFAAIGGAALALLPLGLLPHRFMTPAAQMALPFMFAHAPEHAVDYFSAVNLVGAAKSLVIGLILYLAVVRPFLTRKQEDASRLYVNVKPDRADMEDSLYRPLLRAIIKIGALFSSLCHHAPDWLFSLLKWLGTLIARTASGLLDGVSALLGRTLFAPPAPKKPVPVGTRFTYFLGTVVNRLAEIWNRVVHHSSERVRKYTYFFAALKDEVSATTRKISQSLSFSLLMFSVGLLITLVYLMSR